MENMKFIPKKIQVGRYYLIRLGIVMPIIFTIGDLIFIYNDFLYNRELPWSIYLARWFSNCIAGIVGVMIPSLLGSKQIIRHSSVFINENCVSGPVLLGNKRKSFSLDELDRIKTAKHNLFEKLLGFRSIWSVQGARIIFYDGIFNMEQTNKFLKMLKLDELS